MIRFWSTLILLTTCSYLGFGQELNVSVSLNTPTLQIADPKVFEDLKNNVENFMNNQRWTSDEFLPEERIEVSIAITITEEFSATSFKADLAIQAVRPVYGSEYVTPLISYNDRDFTFVYEQFQPIQYSQNSYNDNLSHVLSFYAFIILGLDYDSFSPYGGEPHFQTAQDILNAVPSGAAAQNPGWQSLDGNRNRYWIVENILSPRTRSYRQAMYDYHRQALDLMHKDVAAGRLIMLQALEDLNSVNQSYPNAMILQMFSLAKDDEIIEIFRRGTRQEKTRVVQIMSKIDPSNASKYRGINSLK